MKKKQIKNYLKTGILLFGVSIFLTNCQYENGLQHIPEQQSKNKIPFEFKKKTYTELSKESKFINAVNVLNKGKVNSSLSAKTVMEDQYGFTIDSTLIKEISSDSYTSYTFLIHRSKSNESYFENLVVTVDSSATPKAYIIKYHLNSQPTYISEDDAYSLDAQTELTPINYNNAQAKVIYTDNDGCTIVTLMCPYDYDHPAGQSCIDADRGDLFWSYDSSNCGGDGGGDSSSPSGNDSTTGGGGGGGESTSSGTTGSTNDPSDPNNHGNGSIISAPVLEDEVVPEPEWNQNLILLDELPGDIINNITDYLKCFDLSMGATFSLFVDQPTANSDETWSGNPINPNVGHTFVSITQNGMTRVFGFYPENGVNPFTDPSDSSVLIDDSSHSFDVSITMNINSNQLTQIHSSVINASSTYNLNTYNCTDFGIDLASIIGLSIPSSSGNWPGGGGDNPGDLGQNIRNINNSNTTVNSTGGIATSNSGSCN